MNFGPACGCGRPVANAADDDYDDDDDALRLPMMDFGPCGCAPVANYGGHGGNDDQKAKFEAVGTFGLAGVTTQQVLTKDGWKTPVVNNANMTNSMNNFSGNGGANVSAGVGNQQSNSLSIAAGCKACM